MKKDFDYIQDRFDTDGEKAPDSLSEENMLAMLEGIENPEQKDTDETPVFETVTATKSVKNRSVMRKIVTVAACLILVLVSVPVVYNIATAPPNTSANNGDFHSFSSYKEIDKLVKSMNSEGITSKLSKSINGDLAESYTSDLASGSTEDSAASFGNSEDAVYSGNYSETYLQVDGVDEADIIKTDGKYIYYVNQAQEVIILEANNGKTTKLSTIGYGDVENYVDDIFLKGNLLITIGWIYDNDTGDGYTGVVTYDISDRTNPVVVNQFKQTGNVISSRMVGNYIYLVTNDYVGYGDRYLPKITVDGSYVDMPLEDISCIPNPDSSIYTIVSAIDVTSGENASSKSKAVFGSTDTIYCNNHSLYAAISRWNDSNSTNETTIIRCEFDGLKVNFDKSATVSGAVNDQFSMDESDGYFRIATTASRNGISVNDLYILDGELNTVGSVSGFARNESIKSVRFMDEKAYVITYEEIDPLFVIDVSNPENPVIEGEVKIDGFSSLLVPVSENRLLGIGYATGDNRYGGEYASGLKLALFDISNPSELKVLDSMEFEDMESPAQYTHLALTVNADDGWYAIPYYLLKDSTGDSDDYDDSEYYEEGGVLRFSAGDSINILEQENLSEDYIQRCVYIEDYIYALNYDGYVYSYKAD